ncbi:hypothetical protein B0H15DRAFT_328304 [Mycena belliarum]|uniref:Uncharacterized protein n=1 Tax=Mycena belliarum TaxID=1033014 RepID=A0AAD6XVH3_9AGAR|nr:hypothetical protein B0H15DRAFT_328304 [Mycena belliae]
MKFLYRPLRDMDSSTLPIPPLSSHKLVPLRFLLASILVLCISVVLNLTLLYFWLYSTQLLPEALYSPAQDVLEYKTVKFHSGFGLDLPIYDQEPSDAVDQAWAGLYEFAYSKIPRTQAMRLPNKTYPILGDNPRTYMLALDVFHELHCLDEIRKAMHPGKFLAITSMFSSISRLDYYPATSEGINTKHMRHCLSSLRQSIMCASDISTIVWQWSDKSQAAKERSDVVHTCRDFSKLQAWSKDHYAGDMQNMSIFIPDDLSMA